jgi:hypothetical protein
MAKKSDGQNKNKQRPWAVVGDNFLLTVRGRIELPLLQIFAVSVLVAAAK